MFYYQFLWSSFCARLTPRKVWCFLFMFSAGFTVFGIFLFLYQSLFSSVCTVLDAFSFDIGKFLSVNLSANVFVFGDLNIHCKVWLTYSGGTNRLSEPSYSFSMSNNHTQMINFPTRIPQIPGCGSYSPGLLVFFINSLLKINRSCYIAILVNH